MSEVGLFGPAGEINVRIPWGMTVSLVGTVYGGTARITSSGTPTGGTFPLTLLIPQPGGGTSPETTGTIAYNASAAVIQAALEDLPSVSAGDVTCSGGALPTAVTVTFANWLAGIDPLSLSADDSALTGGTNPEIEVVRVPQDVTGWTIKLKVMSSLDSSTALEVFELTATLTDATNGKISFAIAVSDWSALASTVTAYQYACNHWAAVITGGPSASTQYLLAKGTFVVEPVGIPA